MCGFEDSRRQQWDLSPDLQDAVATPLQQQAAVAQLGVAGINPRGDRCVVVPQGATDGFLGGWATVDMPSAQRQRVDTRRAGCDLAPPVPISDRPLHLGATECSLPAKVADRPVGVKEDDEAIHSRHIIADWGEFDEPGDWEIPEFQPWTPHSDGKGLISPDGQLLTWATNEYGEPHHDVVAQEENFPYVAKVVIRPNGSALIPSPDDLHLFGITRKEAEDCLQHEAPKQGLRFAPGYTSAARSCPTCGDPLSGQYGTFCPRCRWSEMDANLDSDPLSNPPDPTVDLHRGIQSHTRWFEAIEDSP